MLRPQNTRARLAGLGALGFATLAVGLAPAPTGAQDTQGAPKATKASAGLRVAGAKLNIKPGYRIKVAGRLRPLGGHRAVYLQRLGKGGWKSVARARTARDGRFVVAWRTRRSNSMLVRVRYPGDSSTRSAQRTVGRANVFRPANASYYGPGLYGNRLACGGRLGYGTLGVAHKTLPCGTRVTLRKGARVLRVRVIDRGPFHPSREWDLTAATKRRLGFGSTGIVWVAH